MLARGVETLHRNPLIHMGTNVEKMFARLFEVWKHLNRHVII